MNEMDYIKYALTEHFTLLILIALKWQKLKDDTMRMQERQR